MDKDFSLLEKKLKISFKNKDFLLNAFIHRSYLNENPGFYLPHNERLEFLGDAVLELVVTEDLYKRYPDKTEGELTTWRAALVNAKMLSEVSKELGFNDFILLSKGESKENGKARDYILANTFEAFVGALYLDQGLKSCEKFIEQCILPKLPHVLEAQLFRDSKSSLQERAQEKQGITPTYRSLEEWGPDHEKKFRIGVFFGEKKVAEGEGSSKQEAEENAARSALDNNSW
ncbi:MAG: ribonuclease III [Candidatus Wildermuthbacteria bacterium]|nr:ribonuclease III [Candidatus Wildermuthbacteria bacterium]